VHGRSSHTIDPFVCSALKTNDMDVIRAESPTDKAQKHAVITDMQNHTEAEDSPMRNRIVERSFISFHHIYWNKSTPQWRASAVFAVRVSSFLEYVHRFSEMLFSMMGDGSTAACSIELMCLSRRIFADRADLLMKLQTRRVNRRRPFSATCTLRGADCLASGSGDSSRAYVFRTLDHFSFITFPLH